ncbi:MAG: hypothetical protein DRN57_02365 [Thermoplasmata archaeon]|nr:MAG: hypothetical protein DRN57_02365 [Thermoplasmata archaeon]
MSKRTGLAFAVMMLLAALIPFMGAAEPARAMEAEIVDVMIDGLVGPGGEYASGNHVVTFRVNNTGDVYFVDETTLYLTVYTYPEGTLFYNTSKVTTVVVDNNTAQNFTFGMVDLPEGEYTIAVNGTLAGTETMASTQIDVADVIDLSMTSDFFEEEGTYPLGEEMLPTCTVTYTGNVEDWKDQVSINLRIDLLEDPMVTVYDEDMIIMDNESSPVDPPHDFSVFFSTGWIPNASGNYRARFSVEYDTYNSSNNFYTVYFSIENPPSITGRVTTSLGAPVPDVTVILSGMFQIGETLTDADGFYSFENIDDGTYTLDFSKTWCTSNSTTVTVESGLTKVVNVTINKLAVGGLRGRVTLPNGLPAVGAEVTVSFPGEVPVVEVTDDNGNYTFDTIKAGSADITVTLQGYQDYSRTGFIIVEQYWNELDVELEEIPFTVTISPPDGELAFSVSGTITLQFSKPVNKSTINETTVYLIKLSTSSNVPLSFAFVDSDNVVLLSPQVTLEYQTDYRITVTDLVEDLYGNNFPHIFYSNFTTETQIIEIDLAGRYPADDQSEVPVNTWIRAVFPEAMDSTTISASTFEVFKTGGGGEPISGTVIYYPGNYTAVFKPSQPLEYGSRYSVSLSPDILALDSTKIFRGTTWSFETEQLITTGTLKGYILDEDGKPFPPDKVTITLQKEEGTPIILNVNQLGRFEGTGIEAGTYILKIEIPDYKTYETEVTITAGSTMDLKTIEPEKEGSKGSEFNIGYLLLILLVIVIIIILVYVFLGRSTRPVEAVEEERGRRPAFQTGRERHYREPEYQEPAEGEFLCPVCGFVVASDELDCPNCGAEFEEDLFECPECGAMIPGDVPECPECGAKFEEEEEGEEEESFEEEEELDITEEYQVEELDEEEIPLAGMEG